MKFFQFLIFPLLPLSFVIACIVFFAVLFKSIHKFYNETKHFGFLRFFLTILCMPGAILISFALAGLAFVIFICPLTLLISTTIFIVNWITNQRGIAKYGKEQWRRMKEEEAERYSSNSVDYDSD